MVKKKTCIFISGSGTNLKNLILRSRDNTFPINISLIITDNREAYELNTQKNIKFHFYSLILSKEILRMIFYLISKNMKYLYMPCWLYENNLKQLNSKI